MTKTAYCLDIIVRSFFIFLVGYLLCRLWWLAFLITIVINTVFELTVGKKYWHQFKATPKKPRRHWRQVLLDLWHRIFSRERTKGFIWAGVIILLLSLVVRLNVYYICCACVVFTLAAISRFAPPVKSATIPCESSADPESSTTDCQTPATE